VVIPSWAHFYEYHSGARKLALQVAVQGQNHRFVFSREPDQTLSKLFDVSRELTSIAGRDKLLQRIPAEP
jgi:hypothetical protein